VRLAVWSPLPPSTSGIADYVAEQLPVLAETVDLRVVVEAPEAVSVTGVALATPSTVGPVDLDLYHLGNSPAHGYVLRAATTRPGVVVLHDWSLHDLVLHETVERGERAAYLREMRRAHGQTGTFVARQVARALGGEVLRSLFPVNDRVLETCLGLVGLTDFVASHAGAHLHGRPVLHLPHHLALPEPLPTRVEARRSLGLPADALLVTAPGLATASKRLDPALRANSRLRPAHPTLRLVVAGEVDRAYALAAAVAAAGLEDAVLVTGRLAFPDFVAHLVAADVVLALRFPSRGEISGALVRSLGVGRPVLVTGATPAAREFPDGVVIPVDPGPSEEDEIVALLDHLLRRPERRELIGGFAREHLRRHHDLRGSVGRLVAFLQEVAARKLELLAEVEATRVPEGSLLGDFMDEVRWAARDLGLPGAPKDLKPLLADLAGEGT
jgi:glycosyltransferase involved in cell wall biosynthesis